MVGYDLEARIPHLFQDQCSLVGWGSGEDEETGAILKVHVALGIFYFGKIVGLREGGCRASSMLAPSP